MTREASGVVDASEFELVAPVRVPSGRHLASREAFKDAGHTGVDGPLLPCPTDGGRAEWKPNTLVVRCLPDDKPHAVPEGESNRLSGAKNESRDRICRLEVDHVRRLADRRRVFNPNTARPIARVRHGDGVLNIP